MTRAIGLLLAFAISAALAGQEPARLPSLKIVVVEEGTGLPISNVSLWVTTAKAEPRSATTGGDGTATLHGLPPGTYNVHPTSRAHVFGKSEDVTVSAGATVTVSFRLVRGGVIAGVVTDTEGRALTKARVTLVQEVGDRVGRHPRVDERPSVLTDGNGAFEFAGLTAGEYRVAANPQEGSRAFKNVFYPGTTEIEHAEVLTVALGDRRNIVLRAPRVPMARVQGRVSDDETADWRELTVRRLDIETGDAISYLLIDIKPDGTFSVDLDNGIHGFTYTVKMKMGAAKAAAYEVVHVGEAPVPPIHLRARRLSTMTGRFLFDHTKTPSIEELSVHARATGEDGELRWSLNANSQTSADGSFTLRPVLGRYRFSVQTPDGWLPKAVFLEDGRDVLYKEVDIEPGREYSNVRIVLTDEVATITGSVGAPRRLGMVVAFPVNEASRVDYERTPTADVSENASFVIHNIEPWTEYFVAECAWPCTTRAIDLEEYSRKAVRVRIGPPGSYGVVLKR